MCVCVPHCVCLFVCIHCLLYIIYAQLAPHPSPRPPPPLSSPPPPITDNPVPRRVRRHSDNNGMSGSYDGGLHQHLSGGQETKQ